MGRLVKKVIRVYLLGWLTFYAGLMTYFLICILRNGYVLGVEPRLPLLIAEIVMAVLATIGGLILVVGEFCATNRRTSDEL